MHELVVFEVDGGFGFEVTHYGVRQVHQPYDPDLPGLEPMTEERAQLLGSAVLARLQEAQNAART